MNVEELISDIRRFINSPRRQSVLLKDLAAWNRLCSSLDVIGDTELAFQAYPNLNDAKGEGESYIIVYGMLQAFLLQQDAAKNISDTVLHLKVKLPKELQRIRRIRNSAAGHPFSEKENGVTKSSFIQRYSLTPAYFKLMTVYSSDSIEYQTIDIDIPELIKIQRQYLGDILKCVIDELKRQEMAHRKEHRDKKLRDLFPPTLPYSFEKIYEASHGSTEIELGKMHLKYVDECLVAFKTELETRGEWGVYDSIDYHIELIAYPLAELKCYFETPDKSKLNDKDVYIFTRFLSQQIDELIKIAEEFDEGYETEIES